MSPDLGSAVLPRVLIVSRRTLRKNKFVDFVGEYHLDLIVRYGAVPVIVPRVTGIQSALNSYEPIHGVLLCEGEDIDPSLYKDDSLLSLEEMEEIKRVHGSDTTIDTEKDLIELTLIHLCIKRGIPFFGICRGSQILNIACGGTLYQDIGKEFSRKQNPSDHHHNQILVTHIDYNNYDSHRHPIRIEPDTPLHTWFKDSLPDNKMEIMVNSYHHQGVKTLANRFSSMAYSPDGLIEGFYDPHHYNPDQGKFCVGLQFHPERMRQYSYDDDDDQQFDYPGCGNAYREFVKAVIVFKRKVDVTTTTTSIINRPRWSFLKTRKMMEEEKQEVIINRSFDGKLGEIKQQQQEKEVEEMEELQTVRMLMDRLSLEQLGDLLGFYKSMERVCGELIMEKKKMRSK